jgi:hypothetical protein
VTDPVESQEHYITFAQPGQYIIKLAVVQGKQIIERDQIVVVDPPPGPMAVAVVRTQYQAAWAKTNPHDYTIKVDFPGKIAGPSFPFTKEVPAAPGLQFLAAKFAQPVPAPFIQNARVTLNPEGTKLVVTGEFLPGKWDKKAGNPNWVALVQTTEQKTGKMEVKTPDPVAIRLTAPGTTMVPLPKLSANWKVQQRQFQLELYDGAQAVWKQPKLPSNASVTFYGHPCLVTATEVGDQLKIDVSPDKNGPPLWPNSGAFPVPNK